MGPLVDCFNHDHNHQTGFISINKRLHLDPISYKGYFRRDKYLSDVRMLYNEDSQKDRIALESKSLTHGFQINEQFLES